MKNIRMSRLNSSICIRQFNMLFSIVVVFLWSCVSDDSSDNYSDTPVVEGYITQGNSIKVKVMRQIPFYAEANVSEDDINNLRVSVKCGEKIVQLTPKGKGIYKDTAQEMLPETGVGYDLFFTFNDRMVTASTQILSKPGNFCQSATSMAIEAFEIGAETEFPDPVVLSWENPDESYYMLVVNNMESNPIQINSSGMGNPPQRFFRNRPTQGSSMELEARYFQYYGTHRLILYHLNADYAALFSENGNTSINMVNPATNIQNGLGIFTGLNSDTLYLEITKP